MMGEATTAASSSAEASALSSLPPPQPPQPHITPFATDGMTNGGASSSSSSTTPPTTQHLPPHHPIALKMRSILSTRSSQEEQEKTREALKALEGMYPGKGNASTSSSSSSLKSPPSPLLPPPHVDVSRARRNLEKDAREEMLASSTAFIKTLREVDTALTVVTNELAAMSDTCDELDNRLTHSSNDTRYLLEQAQGLQRQQATTEQQRAILELFLQRFTLPANELQAITDASIPVGSRLFAAMDHLAQIRTDCRALLEGGGSVGGGTRAGTDIMSVTSGQLEKAYQKIAKYLAFQFRQTPREGMDVSKTVRAAVSRLVNAREDLLRPKLQTLITLRSSFLSTSFHQALTTGSSSTGSRPIELQAHDPLRYVGDMLAWIHQTVAGEREFYGQLFSEQDNEGGRRVGQRRRNIDGSVDLSSGVPTDKRAVYAREMLDRSLEGCCHPLSSRVEQTIRSQEGCITTFKLANLVQFYKIVMDNTIGSRASVSKMLNDLSTSSYDAFFATLERHGQGLVRYVQPPDSNLAVPPALESSVGVLSEILAVHQASLAEVEADAESTSTPSRQPSISTSIANFNAVVGHLTTPILDLIHGMEGALAKPNGRQKKTSPTDPLVFRINCIEFIKVSAVPGRSRCSESLTTDSTPASPRTPLPHTHSSATLAQRCNGPLTRLKKSLYRSTCVGASN